MLFQNNTIIKLFREVEIELGTWSTYFSGTLKSKPWNCLYIKPIYSKPIV